MANVEDKILDVGCGWPRICLGNPWIIRTDYLGDQLTEERRGETVCHLDITRPLPYDDNQFGGAFAVRVISALPEAYRPEAIRELRRVCHGPVVLCDPYARPRENADRLREYLGFKRLGTPRSGAGPISRELERKLEEQASSSLPIAPDYVVWSRVLRQEPLPWNACHPIRERVPCDFSAAFRREVAFYRLVCLP